MAQRVPVRLDDVTRPGDESAVRGTDVLILKRTKGTKSFGVCLFFFVARVVRWEEAALFVMSMRKASMTMSMPMCVIAIVVMAVVMRGRSMGMRDLVRRRVNEVIRQLNSSRVDEEVELEFDRHSVRCR
jgi:hypothetical protein